MQSKLSETPFFHGEKIVVPDIIHFVWIGDKRKINFEYIDIWQKANESKVVYLWMDEGSGLTDYFHRCIREYALDQSVERHDALEINIKNIAFSSMFSKLKEGFPFDKLAEAFLSDHDIHIRKPARRLSDARFNNGNIVIKDIAELFIAEFHIFMKYYYYEIILRGNLASASDIVRLLVLYSYGGVYVDMDTLPCTDNVFARLNGFLKRRKIPEDDDLLLLKTQCVLNKLTRTDEPLSYDVDTELGLYKGKFEEILRLIELDMAAFSFAKIRPLGKIQVHKNLLAVASLRRLKGIYFNNFMASHPGSKSVRIILRTMKKRYQFIEKNNCVFGCYNGEREGQYLSRILTWRTELITKNYCVTSVLTGPGLILEVLLGLAYQLLDLEGIAPSAVAEFFQDEDHGIALYQHNLDTPDGLHSTWRQYDQN